MSRARDIADGTLNSADINGGTIDGTDITVGAGKTLNVSYGTLTLAANQISGDSIHSGTISDFASTGIDDNASSGPALTIDSSGNVGIGTSSPSSLGTLNGKVLNLHHATYGLSAGAKLLFSADQTAASRPNGEIQWANTNGLLSTIAGPSGSSSGSGGNLVFSTATDAGANTERMRIDSSGNLKFDSGYGSVATAYACRAWVNFNGTGTVAIRESGNVSSITDRGTGLYTVTFTTAMPDVNYAGCCSATNGGATSVNRSCAVGPVSTSSCYVNSWQDSSSSFFDVDQIHIAIFR